MFIHHFFSFPSSIICGVDYPWIQWFAEHFRDLTKICVPIFAFLTGYFYYFTPQKNYRYSLKKILDLLIPYCAVYLLLLLLAAADGYRPDLHTFLTEFLGLKVNIMIFCWYVRFYILAMLVLPIYVRFVPKSIGFSLVVSLLLPYIVLSLLTSIPALQSPLGSLASNFPTIAVGYLFAQHDLFRSWFDTFPGHDTGGRFQWFKWVSILAAVLCGKQFVYSITLGSLDSFAGGIPLYFSMDLIYAPCFVYCLANLFNCPPRIKFVRSALAQIGKMSMLMWFLHCAFFNYSAHLLQPILYFPRNPVLVLLWGLFLCYTVARGIDAMCRPLIQFKNRLLMA